MHLPIRFTVCVEFIALASLHVLSLPQAINGCEGVCMSAQQDCLNNITQTLQASCSSNYKNCIFACSTTYITPLKTATTSLPLAPLKTTTTSSSPEIYTLTLGPPPKLFTSTLLGGSQCAADQIACGSACCDKPHGIVGAGEFCASPEKSLCCSTFSAGYCGGVCCPGSTGVCRNDKCLKLGSREDCRSRPGPRLYDGYTCDEEPGCSCFDGCCLYYVP